MKLFSLSLLLVFQFSIGQSQKADTLFLWPGSVPKEKSVKHTAIQTSDTTGNISRLTDVTNPILIIFEPELSINNGIGVIVSPGGGYRILAIDLEGYEIANWLNQLGYTAFVLQYRVPNKQEGALQDIQRAIRIVKSKAADWNIEPDKLGLIGFSAGANLSVRVSAWDGKTSYSPIDEKDSLSFNTAFNLLIYPGDMDQGKNRSLSPNIVINQKTPPTFIFATADDRHVNSLMVLSEALIEYGTPVESHLLPLGGHGYGLRPGNYAGETWPLLAEKWLLKNILE